MSTLFDAILSKAGFVSSGVGPGIAGLIASGDRDPTRSMWFKAGLNRPAPGLPGMSLMDVLNMGRNGGV